MPGSHETHELAPSRRELYKSALNFYTDSSGAAYQPGYFFSSDSLSLTSLRKSNPGFSPRLPKTIFNELLYKINLHDRFVNLINIIC